MSTIHPISNQTKSVWLEDVSPISFSNLISDLMVDVCIIGAGIAGISIAYQLSRENLTVAVIESDQVASGQTGRTTAHLANGLDDHYFELERLHGQEGAKLAANSHTEAINFIENVIQHENIDCDFTRLDAYLFLAPGMSPDFLKKELAAAQRAGLTDVELLDSPTLTGFNPGHCLRFPKQAQFHPLKYMLQLAKIAAQNGVKIYTDTHVEDIQSGITCQLKTSSGYTISANKVVIATNTPFYDKNLIFSKQEPNRTYVIGARIPKNSLTTALYWDTADPYHYVRLQPLSDDKDLLIIGGEDHRVGKSPDSPFSHLEAWTRFNFPFIEDVIYQWSGHILEPADYLAFIGRMSSKENNLYVVTGDSGNGMTHGTIAGMLISDLILGKENPWEKLYDPARSILKNPKELIIHNFGAAENYLEYLLPGEVKSVDEIQPQQGAIIREGIRKIAVYRDEDGHLHKLSATCSHLGGIVHWNSIEKSWDCPAHGSRFSVCGKVLNGPAAKPLAPVKEKNG